MGRGSSEYELGEIVREGFDLPLPAEITARELVEYLTPEMIDRLTPEHTRTSCSDDNLANAYAPPEHGRPRCIRCALIKAAESGYGPKSENVTVTVRIETTVVYDGEHQRRYRDEQERGRRQPRFTP